MSDPLSYDDLVSLANRRETYEIAATLCAAMTGRETTIEGSLSALVACFRTICEAADIDPEAAYDQLADLDDSGELSVADEEVADIDHHGNHFRYSN